MHKNGKAENASCNTIIQNMWNGGKNGTFQGQKELLYIAKKCSEA